MPTIYRRIGHSPQLHRANQHPILQKEDPRTSRSREGVASIRVLSKSTRALMAGIRYGGARVQSDFVSDSVVAPRVAWPSRALGAVSLT